MLRTSNKGNSSETGRLSRNLTGRETLQAWVDGNISTDDAAHLSNATSIINLYDLALSHDVDHVKIQRIHGETDAQFVARFLKFHEELAKILEQTAK